MDTPIAPGRKRSWRWLIAGVIILFIGLLITWQMERTNPNDGGIVEVWVGPIEETIPISVEAVPTASRLLTTIMGGTVEELVAAPGQMVSPGDILIRLSNPTIARDLMDAETDLAVARAEVATEQDRLQAEISGIALDLDKAELDLGVARAQMDAERKLQEAGISSRIALVRSQSEFEKQKMSTQHARRKLAMLRSSLTARIQPKRAKVRALEDRARYLRQALDALVVRAPFRGLYAAQDLKVGQSMAAGAIVAEVISKETELRVSIPAGYGGRVGPGQSILIDGDQKGGAELTSIEPVVRDDMLHGRARLKAGARRVANGATFTAELVVKTHGSGTFIKVSRPSLANRTINLTVEDGDGRRRNQAVTFGDQYGNILVVKDGLAKGDEVHGM